ncbi:uncharacterized protein LOC129768612 isoform X1 [Toxorhynchites rutilus septentrionalis]|uniref:uncharacterized protein LOC129768612 isoform X1 n=2 Tax=Toxorhynchites rutilus septentrionalis TaxID=329112 RepID=UPI002478DE5A|nr:uncharacterized protein LOC129768612 isoform X1 [Toxorhynchites rutilus septentrionalis]
MQTHNGRFKTSSNGFPSVPLLTVTDLQQKWGKIAEKVADDMYKTTPLTAFCKKMTNTKDTTEAASPAGLTHDEGTNILQLFVKGFPESGLAYEKKGREMKNIDKNDESDVLNTLLDIDVQSHSTESIDSLISIEENMTCSLLKSFLRRSFHPDNFTMIDREIMEFIGPLEKDLQLHFEINVKVSEYESLKICTRTIEQRVSSQWKKERSRRITSSSAYSVYTYYTNQPDKNKNWKSKILSMVTPKHLSTPAIVHGIRCESKAIAAYERDYRKNVWSCGFVIPPHISWLGCSPDGIVINEGRIIEIKCPKEGEKSLCDLIDFLPYFTRLNVLKKNHQYYAQLQLTMFITKCRVAE